MSGLHICLENRAQWLSLWVCGCLMHSELARRHEAMLAWLVCGAEPQTSDENHNDDGFIALPFFAEIALFFFGLLRRLALPEKISGQAGGEDEDILLRSGIQARLKLPRASPSEPCVGYDRRLNDRR